MHLHVLKYPSNESPFNFLALLLFFLPGDILRIVRNLKGVISHRKGGFLMDFEIKISELRKILNDLEKRGYNYVYFSEVESKPDLVDINGRKRKELKNPISFKKA